MTDSLASVYDTIEDVDLWLGAIAEDAVGGGLVGETLREIIVDQFTRSRDGDRFYYENDQDLLALFPAIGQTTLSEIIVRNSAMDSMPLSAFLVPEPSAILLGLIAACLASRLSPIRESVSGGTSRSTE